MRTLLALALLGCHASSSVHPDSASPPDTPKDTSDAGGECAAAWTCTAVAHVQTDQTLPNGVIVRQLTSTGRNFLTYVDVPATGACGRIIYDGDSGQTGEQKLKTLYSAAGDGSNAVELAHAVGGGLEGAYVTGDGALAYWVQGDGPDPQQPPLDLWSAAVADATCGATQLSHLALTTSDVASVEISSASYDQANHRWVLGFATDSEFHRIAADTGAEIPSAPLSDPTHTLPFHRVRLNPVCPNILMYRRDAGNNIASPDIWVVDYNAASPLPRSINAAADANHPVWSPDGSSIGYSAAKATTFAIADVVDPATCALRPGVTAKSVTPADATLSPGFCTWSPDRSVFACDTNCRLPGNGVTTSDTIFLMSPSGAVKTVVDTGRDCTNGGKLDGQPDTQFASASELLYTSDHGGAPQVYRATLPAGFGP